jgi:triosephosphate isomerase
MKKLVIGNWKMNGTVDLLNNFIEIMNNDNFVIALPFHLICLAKSLNNTARIAAQNCSVYNGNGAYTGEISAQMLKESGVEYVIVGHSERRKLFNDSSEIINQKLANCVSAGLKIVYCVSELYRNQIKDELKNIDIDIVIAYEPVSAIGTGVVPTLEEVEATIDDIKDCFGPTEAIKFLYGGSVSKLNIRAISEISNVDGVLVGGASLTASEVGAMLNEIESPLCQWTPDSS